MIRLEGGPSFYLANPWACLTSSCNQSLRQGFLGRTNCRRSDFNFLLFSVIFALAGKWIECCDFCNNLSEQSVPAAAVLPPHWIVKQLRHQQQHTKDFHSVAEPNSAAAEQCSNRGDGLLKGLSMEVKSGVSWCRPVLAPYLEAVYRKPTLSTKVSAAEVAAWTNSNLL